MPGQRSRPLPHKTITPPEATHARVLVRTPKVACRAGSKCEGYCTGSAVLHAPPPRDRPPHCRKPQHEQHDSRRPERQRQGDVAA